jgi:leukotriene A-4 hydrolase/aminopeptidase
MRVRLLFFAVLLTAAIGVKAQSFADDIHSYADPNSVRVVHVDLDWTISFDEKSIKGSATLNIVRANRTASLILDTRDLKIDRAETSVDGASFKRTTFELAATDKILGSKLTVKLPAGAKRVRIFYATSPNASGLQWLSPAQTAGKKQPYMFSQAQAIHARSMVPIQDSPQIRVTYSARVQTPKNLLAVMSAAGNNQTNKRNGDYRFLMSNPIPPYLIAIAVGDIRFKSLGPRTGVYTEPSMMAKASYELADTEKMVVATEKIYGPYRWGRYDLLVLPPSFPFGGMENPMLTFATPTILAGDRSLVSLVAHELAHSWSGNLVTNATWRDFWLNEGFTTYLERRILEAVYGKNRREMEAMLGKRTLLGELAELPPSDQILHIDLAGRDPDEGMTNVAYEKGALFLRFLEEKFGRAEFDRFVKGYFNAHAFKSITTDTFAAYLDKNLLSKRPGIVTRADVDVWLNESGLPSNAPDPMSENFAKVASQANEYLAGKLALNSIATKAWTTQEWLQFLKTMPTDLDTAKMAELDKAFGLTMAGNSEVAFQWLLMAIRTGYSPADARLEQFLMSIGRRKFVRPLYTELSKKDMPRACKIYTEARSGYHPITQGSIDAIVKCN